MKIRLVVYVVLAVFLTAGLSYLVLEKPGQTGLAAGAPYREYTSTPGITLQGQNFILVSVACKNNSGVDFGLCGIKSVQTTRERSYYKSVTLREILRYDMDGIPLEQRVTVRTYLKRFGAWILYRTRVNTIDNPEYYDSEAHAYAPWSEHLAADLYNGRTFSGYVQAGVISDASIRIEIEAATIDGSGEPTSSIIAEWVYNFVIDL